ncbi:MAG: cupin domain-containing protein [Bacillota bacterium]|nr:cupin domain-containing protein [Bacillota bacterium]
MFFMNGEHKHEIKSDLKGGFGDLDFKYIVPTDMMYGAGNFYAEVTFKPGQSIGLHDHVDNFEIYYVLKGEATVVDGNEERVLKPGESEICANGEFHSIANKSNEDTVILAIILNKAK